MPPDVIVVLGCRIEPDGRPGPAARRRVERAAQMFRERPHARVIVAGGRRWHGVSEAEAFSRALTDRGVPESAIVQENWSLSTLENARYVAHVLRDSACRHVSLVTCDWHMPRAEHCFRLLGFSSEAVPAPSPAVGAVRRTLRLLLEHTRTWLTRLPPLVLLLVLLFAACRGSDSAPHADAQPATDAAGADANGDQQLVRLAALEARRDSQAIGGDELRQRNVQIRRRAARALARIADARAAELLSAALADEDADVVRWAAYGLGVTCKGRESEVVRRLALRGASAALATAGAPPVEEALTAALARCATPEAEHTLRAWLDGSPARRRAAALGLGRLAAERSRLDDTSLVALLDAAGAAGQKRLPEALFAFTRLPTAAEPLASRLRSSAVRALRGPPEARAYAVRALGRSGSAAVPELARVLGSDTFLANERADAARELARLGDDGQRALLESLRAMAPGASERAKVLMSAHFGVLLSVLEGLRPAAAAGEGALSALAALPLEGSESKPLARRIVALRCSAAAILAKTRSLFPALVACDPDREGRTGQLAVLRVLDRAPLTEARYARWRGLLGAKDAVVKQAAIGLMPGHPEIEEPYEVLAHALGAKEDGTVAAAARVLAAYPDRATEQRHPPRVHAGAAAPVVPALKPAAALLRALEEAFQRTRSPDAIETRVALVDAVAALQLLSYKRAIEGDCKSPNPTLREHAERALRLLGDQRKSCAATVPHAEPPAELVARVPRELALRFETDVGELVLRLSGDYAPLAVARVQELVRRRFYDGMTVHRAVPGFVVQFGDPGGDGFGGAALPPLPCETSPLHFDDRSVGVALAGRDTGSSQLFVALGPQPHLDGKYSLIGRAEPGWDRLAAGDVIHEVTIVRVSATPAAR